LVPDVPLPDWLFDQLVIQRTPPGVTDWRREAFGIPRHVALFLVHLGPPHTWTPYTFDVVGTFPEYEATRERFWLDLPAFWDTYNLPGIVVWYRRVYLEEPGVSVAIRWYPHREEESELFMPLRLPRTYATRYRTTGLRLLQDLGGRGRPPGPAGFQDAQQFEETVIQLMQSVSSKGQEPTQERIATLLRIEINDRRKDSGSPASVDIDVKSTVRLLQRHLSCPWDDLRDKALHPH
jgi:hypothetical protein